METCFDVSAPVLPQIMVAPNGARRGKGDHPAIPISDDELIATARSCFDAGADGIHVHIRDSDGRHLLDGDRYQALLDRLAQAVPGMFLQVTSEAAGRYAPEDQQAMVRALRPRNVSVAFREMVRSDADRAAAHAFYHWAAEADVQIQHIVYTQDNLDQLIAAMDSGMIPGQSHQVQLVLGTYDGTVKSDPAHLPPLVDRMTASAHVFDWMLCAFGAEETDCLMAAHRLGGKMRIGFENSLWHTDGRLARDNAERVAALKTALPK